MAKIRGGWFFLQAAMVLFLLTACTARQPLDDFAGATQQRLVAYSIDESIGKLPQADFDKIADTPVHLECRHLGEEAVGAYACRRFALELIDDYHCEIVETPRQASFQVVVFFTGLGTERDKAGFKTPDLVLPGVGGISSIDILTVDMFHGVAELQYYILDRTGAVVAKSERIKSVVRTDALAFPIITIPLSGLE
jgi:hypothetical protein